MSGLSIPLLPQQDVKINIVNNLVCNLTNKDKCLSVKWWHPCNFFVNQHFMLVKVLRKKYIMGILSLVSKMKHYNHAVGIIVLVYHSIDFLDSKYPETLQLV